MMDDLVTQSRLAVDTESNSLHAFREQVCLVQISSIHADYLIDPLVLKDLSALAPIFSNPKMEKIFHAAEYDLVCLRRDFGFSFANLFDTMHAARVLGYPAVGLDRLLKQQIQNPDGQTSPKGKLGGASADKGTNPLCTARHALSLRPARCIGKGIA